MDENALTQFLNYNDMKMNDLEFGIFMCTFQSVQHTNRYMRRNWWENFEEFVRHPRALF